MAATMTLAGDWMINIGNRRQTSGTGNLGTYATNGVTVSAATVGLGVINSLVIDPAGGYTFEYVASTGKVKAYYGLSSHTHTLHFQTSAAANAVTAAANSLRTAAAAFDVAGVANTSGEGGVVAVSSAAGSEVATTTDLSGITFNWRAIGY